MKKKTIEVLKLIIDYIKLIIGIIGLVYFTVFHENIPLAAIFGFIIALTNVEIRFAKKK